jgi:hypothetical protein
MFDEAFQAGCAYRSTLIALGNLASDRTEQYDLFEDRVAIASCRRLTRATDDINARYGKYTLSSAASLFLPPNPSSPRETPPQRWNLRFPGETARRRLAVPRGEMQV